METSKPTYRYYCLLTSQNLRGSMGYHTWRVLLVKHLVWSYRAEIAFFWKHLSWEDEEKRQMGEKTKIIGMVNLVFIKILLFTWLRKGIPGGIPGGMLPPGAIGIKPVVFFFFSLPDICSRLEDTLWYLFDDTHLLGTWKATAPEDDPLQGRSELLKALAGYPASFQGILMSPVAHI